MDGNQQMQHWHRSAMSFDHFLRWEKASRQSIDFKTVYVDMTGDLIAGLLLSQIVYWHLPDDAGKSKLRVERDGILWLVKSHDDWWAEVRISAKQAKRALALLERQGLIERQYHRFNGLRTTHIRIIKAAFMKAWGKALALPQGTSESPDLASPVSTKGTDRKVPKGPTQTYQRDRAITETIETEIKETEIINTNSHSAAVGDSISLLSLKRDILESMGIAQSMIQELLALDRDGPFLQRWALWVEEGNHQGIRSVLGMAVAGIRKGDEPPNSLKRAMPPMGS